MALEHLPDRQIKWDGYFSEINIDLRSVICAEHLRLGRVIPGRLDLNYALEFAGLQSHNLQPEKYSDAQRKAMLEAEIFLRIVCGKPFYKDFKKFEIPANLDQSVKR